LESGLKTLLINWVYYRPVGHVIEALRVACGIARANPDLRISLLLNAESPAELAECVDCIEHVYRAAVETSIPKELPREWDYVVSDPRSETATGWAALDRFHETLRSTVRGASGAALPRKIEPLRLTLPQAFRDSAEAHLAGGGSPRLSVLLGGASRMRAPSLAFWTRLFDAFLERHPNGEIVLLGKIKGARSTTRGVTARDVAALCERYPAIRNAFDLPLLEQLALAERCNLHISPHSGMSFAVQAVGVPWLAISGQEWHEFLLNGVPLVSIYPECPLYPCYREMYPECRTQMRRDAITPCLSDDALFAKLPAIMDAVDSLLAGTVDYHEQARAHDRALRERGVPDSWAILDWPAVVADDYVF
jgi:hypothetical protein